MTAAARGAAIRRFLILHGLGNERPSGHWQWWLAERLRRAREPVIYPQFPRPAHPDLSTWLALLAAEYAQLGDGERIVICHSLGCATWYQAWARGVLARPADRLLLVAPPGPAVLARAMTAEFARGALDGDTLRASAHHVGIVCSDDDPNSPEGPATEIYGRRSGLPGRVVTGAGHFTTPDGYGPWPGLLRWCLGTDPPPVPDRAAG